jgi:hypothetical protein
MLYARTVVTEPIELPPTPRPRRGLQRAGIPRRHERWFNYGLAGMVAAFAIGWVFAVASASEAGGGLITTSITDNPLSPNAAPPAAYLLEAAVRRFADADYRGASGAVTVLVQEPGDSLALPDSLPPEAVLEFAPVGGDSAQRTRSAGSGVWNVLVRMRSGIRAVPDLTLVRLVPLTEKQGGRIGSYVIGDWPYENGMPKSPQYAPPAGLVRVTPENQDVMVSEHFRLRDFLPKDQFNVWPKYLVLETKLLDKLELVLEELRKQGVNTKGVRVMSGFRTPQYNSGVGDTRGRASLSRHMYGDAADIYIDNDGNGSMDDLNRDGRVDIGDAQFIRSAAERVERAHPSLIGGIGVYRANAAHGPFTHIDTRGYRARW